MNPLMALDAGQNATSHGKSFTKHKTINSLDQDRNYETGIWVDSGHSGLNVMLEASEVGGEFGASFKEPSVVLSGTVVWAVGAYCLALCTASFIALS